MKQLAELNFKHKNFCLQYLDKDFRLKDAADATPINLGRARNWMQDPLIQNEIARLMRRREERVAVSKERLIREYAKIAFSNITNFMTVSGGQVAVRDFSELSEADTSCISEISEAKDGTVRLKLHDKKGALDSLSKHVGLFSDDIGGKTRPLVNIIIEGGEDARKIKISSGDEIPSDVANGGRSGEDDTGYLPKRLGEASSLKSVGRSKVLDD